MRRRVVVTGMGMITPVGSDVESSWRSLCEGRGGVGPITLFDAAAFPTRIAAEAGEFRLSDYRHDADRWREHSRTSQFALAAATMAVSHAGLDDASIDRARFGVYLGSGEGEQDFGRFVDLVHKATHDGRVDRGAPVFTSMGAGSLHRDKGSRPGAGETAWQGTSRPSSAPGGRTRRARRRVPRALQARSAKRSN